MKDRDHYNELSKSVEFIDGKPYWTVARSARTNSGDLAGSLNDRGYRQICISINSRRVMLKAHRLNFYMVYGYIPRVIDHTDRDKDNNDISNLRECTMAENSVNKGKRSGCSSKYKGVVWRKNAHRWYANITVDYKTIYLGSFTSEIHAGEAYNTAAIKYFGDFACINEI